ncbi:MAG: hypothetical protein RL338_309 [Chloroflexota bacterium]|jgi:hypothetical protein
MGVTACPWCSEPLPKASRAKSAAVCPSCGATLPKPGAAEDELPPIPGVTTVALPERPRPRRGLLLRLLIGTDEGEEDRSGRR